jgi:hypothetical protein
MIVMAGSTPAARLGPTPSDNAASASIVPRIKNDPDNDASTLSRVESVQNGGIRERIGSEVD